MLQSILVYGFMIITLCLLLQTKVRRCDGSLFVVKSPDYKLRYGLALGVIVFFMALRWDVGIDHLGYVEDYLTLQKHGFISRKDMEAGFVWLMKILAQGGFHFTLTFGLFAFIQAYFTFSYFRNEKYLLPYFSFLILTGNLFFMWSNIIRHTIVIAVFLCLARCMTEKKNFFLYLLVIALLTTIHYSALILIPFYGLFYLDLEKFYIPRRIQYILLFGSLLLSSLSLWQYLMEYLDVVLSFVGYDRYSADLLLSIGDREMNFGARRILLLAIDLIIITYSPILRKEFKTKTFGLGYIFFMLYFILMPLFIDNMALSRLIDYFQVGRLLSGSYLLFYLFRYKKSLKNILVGLFLSCLLLLHLLVQIYADQGNHTDCVRYQFLWDFV